MRETRVGPVPAPPLVVEPSPARVQLWLDAQVALDAAPVSMTLSDGGRWTRDRLHSRWELSTGAGLGRLAAALQAGLGVAGLSVQWDPVERAHLKVGVSAAGRLVYGGGWDVSLTPLVSWRHALGARVALVPFLAARLRGGETLYEVQGWDADRASPFASAVTEDLALAPMVGAALVVGRFELRATAGWEAMLASRVGWEHRPTDLSRGTGPFVHLALRGALRWGVLR